MQVIIRFFILLIFTTLIMACESTSHENPYPPPPNRILILLGEETDKSGITPPSYPGGYQGLFHDVGKCLIYPEDARQQEIEGKVIVSLRVHINGTIEIFGVEGSKNSLLQNSAVDAVKKIFSERKAAPATKAGKPITYEMYLPLGFKLK
ncbi:hypothetical protein BKI52_18220 [marine bacterium AO1-C]|nr:hypothetical protein BKI52_18220 [marine bacterium AO1-C]